MEFGLHKRNENEGKAKQEQRRKRRRSCSLDFGPENVHQRK